MAYTKQDLIDAFCASKGYDNEDEFGSVKLPDETKLEFVNRLMKQWAKQQALKYLIQQERMADAQRINDDVDGIEL